jgi:polyhydroxyalkanoate synthesis regulator phasin
MGGKFKMDEMSELIKRMGLMGLGLAILTKEKADELAAELVEKGQMNQEDSAAFVSDLVKKSEKQKTDLEKKINEEIKKAVGKLNLATKDDIKKLEKRIILLEKKKR